MHILVADGDDMMGECAARWLGERGHKVAVVRDTRELFRALAQSTPDTILLGHTFGDLPLAETVRHIRTSARIGCTYLVALLDTASTASIPELLDMGADDYIYKPCSHEDLIGRAEALARVRLRHERTHVGQSHDWSQLRDPTGLATWRAAGRTMSESLGDMVGKAVERVSDGRGVSAPGFASVVASTSAVGSPGIQLGLALSGATLREVGRMLLGDWVFDRETLEDIVREMANTAAGAFKRMAHQHDATYAMGLPVNVSLETLAEFQYGDRPCLTYRLAGCEGRFSLFLRVQDARAVTQRDGRATAEATEVRGVRFGT